MKNLLIILFMLICLPALAQDMEPDQTGHPIVRGVQFTSQGSGSTKALGITPIGTNVINLPATGTINFGFNAANNAITSPSNGNMHLGVATSGIGIAFNTVTLGGPAGTTISSETLGIQNAAFGANIAGVSFTIQGSQSTGTGLGGPILFQTTPASGTPSSTANSFVTAMRILGSGLVGIGTSPLSELDVYGNIAIGTSYAGVTAAPTNGMIVQGSVAIGTSSATPGEFTLQNASAHAGQAACWTTGGAAGYCTTVVGSTGACTCTGL